MVLQRRESLSKTKDTLYVCSVVCSVFSSAARHSTRLTGAQQNSPRIQYLRTSFTAIDALALLDTDSCRDADEIVAFW